jgi:hypothetical protein
MHIQINNITPATSQYYIYDILSLTNLTPLTADMIPYVQESLSLSDDVHIKT